jgi:hypothetical protein
MSKESARAEAKRAKDDPRKWAADHYTDLLKADIESATMKRTPPTDPEILKEKALTDAAYFFGESGNKEPAPAAPALSGMAFAPSLQTRPAYQGPVRSGMRGNPNIEEAQVVSETPRKTTTVKGGVKAEMAGDKVTMNGKQYTVVNGIVTIAGKKYKVQ